MGQVLLHCILLIETFFISHSVSLGNLLGALCVNFDDCESPFTTLGSTITTLEIREGIFGKELSL